MIAKLNEWKEWYEAHEKHVSTFSLVFGFIFDSLTLKRIDSVVDQVWLGVNLFSIGLCIILINREENKKGVPVESESWKHFWLFNILQFSIGALLGASFIFYFRSATLAQSWPFLALLLSAMIGNEVFKKHYERLIFQLSFLYLSIFVFAIFLLPLIVHKIGASIFLLSGIMSLVLLAGFVALLRKFSKERFSAESWWRIRASIAFIFGFINLLYFTNFIPPIPLSLKDAGIYHAISLNGQDNYQVAEERVNGLAKYFSLTQKVHWIDGEPLYAYTAVFSPGSLNTQIIHEWQRKDEAGNWVTDTRIPLYLSGGRPEGFRTYSTKYVLSAGKWRVNVETPRGQLIGRINFEIIETITSPTLTSQVKS